MELECVCQFQLIILSPIMKLFLKKVEIVDFRNFLSSKSEILGFFFMKEASNQKMVLKNIVQNFIKDTILKKSWGADSVQPPPLCNLLGAPANFSSMDVRRTLYMLEVNN